ncbi:MAG: GNAT family N-acetyltransferase [Proteobacteria bacterium]|nr:GNAT family N-acetyltransferase [Pseudomonadota bacterium]
MEDDGDRPTWLIEPLGRHHDRAAFSCAKPALDRYLKSQAGQDARRHIAAPFVLVGTPGGKTVLGYYTLSAVGIELGDLPQDVAKKLPRYPIVPATLLGRLAVDRRYRGQGFGEILLMDALHRSFTQSSEIAAAAVLVDAMDEDAWRFYRHFDFIPFPERRDRLFLPMKTVERLFK